MGHAFAFTLPDVVTRYKRMRGYNVLWLPGTDHASIAVHTILENQLRQEGKTASIWAARLFWSELGLGRSSRRELSRANCGGWVSRWTGRGIALPSTRG
jgi:hypothetical protein